MARLQAFMPPHCGDADAQALTARLPCLAGDKTRHVVAGACAVTDAFVTACLQVRSACWPILRNLRMIFAGRGGGCTLQEGVVGMFEQTFWNTRVTYDRAMLAVAEQMRYIACWGLFC
jgi:hypothetical protein